MRQVDRVPELTVRLGKVWALVRRDFRINVSYKATFGLDAIFGMVNLLIYYFISRVVEPAPGADLGAAPSFFAFAAVGATVTVVIQAASASLARRIREEQLTGTLEVLSAQPLSTVEMASGFAAFPFLFAAGRALLYLLLGAAFLGLDLTRAAWGGFALLLALAGIALSTFGILMGALTLTFKRAEVLASLLTLGLGLAGGAFFPISVLPRWLQPIAEKLPTRWVFDGIRNALFAGRGWASEAWALAGFSIPAAAVALFVFSRALHRARATGTLGQY